MSEWLTTGQMLDQLRVDEVAECVSGILKGTRVKKFPATVTNYSYIAKEDGSSFSLPLTYPYLICEWRILPRYVSFEEAMKALMNGKTVWLWQGDGKVGYYIDRESGKLWAIVGDYTGPVERIYFGEKWTIEE